jgi:hypothetical protein
MWHHTQQNGRVERQLQNDRHRANAMMDARNLTTSQLRQKHMQDGIKYASIMANMSIRGGKSAYGKLFNFRRLGYMTIGNTLMNKYRPRAVKGMTIGYSDDHSLNTYKVVKLDTWAQVILTRNVRWEHWKHPTKSKCKSQKRKQCWKTSLKSA